MDVSDSAFVGIIRGYVFYFLSPLGGYIADKILKSTLRLYGYGFIILGVLFFITTQVPAGEGSVIAVSYTHLDVYKRQEKCSSHSAYIEAADFS